MFSAVDEVGSILIKTVYICIDNGVKWCCSESAYDGAPFFTDTVAAKATGWFDIPRTIENSITIMLPPYFRPYCGKCPLNASQSGLPECREYSKRRLRSPLRFARLSSDIVQVCGLRLCSLIPTVRSAVISQGQPTARSLLQIRLA